jgi:hypothetical protein
MKPEYWQEKIKGFPETLIPLHSCSFLPLFLKPATNDIVLAKITGKGRYTQLKSKVYYLKSF